MHEHTRVAYHQSDLKRKARVSIYVVCCFRVACVVCVSVFVLLFSGVRFLEYTKT